MHQQDALVQRAFADQARGQAVCLSGDWVAEDERREHPVSSHMRNPVRMARLQVA
jgi:hypothetical protein